MTLRLRRYAPSPIRDGVRGELQLGNLTLFTQEDDWEQNKTSVSCIPAGVYPLRRTIYYKHGIETWEVCNVPGRRRILIHVGNTEEDTMGCILVGTRLGKLWVADEDDPKHPVVEKWGVVNSRMAFQMLMNAMANVDEAQIEIQWIEGEPK